MADQRYGSARWKKLRRQILYRDGQQCRVMGPNCQGWATSVHHLVPSSQAPHLFFEPSNLVASCGRCNYGGGSRVASSNTRNTISRLHEIIAAQQQEIEVLIDRLNRYENPAGNSVGKAPPKPAIY